MGDDNVVPKRSVAVQQLEAVIELSSVVLPRMMDLSMDLDTQLLVIDRTIEQICTALRRQKLLGD